jgi:phosphate:Na+ symporter
MSLAAKGVVSLNMAFVMVLGANLGTALNPIFESSSTFGLAGKRLPLGNLATRVIGCAVALLVLRLVGASPIGVSSDPARAVAAFHTLFNVAVAVLFFPVLGPFAKLLQRALSSHAEPADPSRAIYLDDAVRGNPTLALAVAAREALRMVDVLRTMITGAIDAIEGDRKRIPETKRLDDVLDRLNRAIKDYLMSITREELAEQDRQRLFNILLFATNLEHAGDVIERNLMAHAAKRLKRDLSFSNEGHAEIRDMLERLTSNLGAAAAVFMTEDARAARQLADQKGVFRDLEARAIEAHFERLRAGGVATSETTSLHLDVLRDLKRVNSHLVEGAAYPVLRAIAE